MRVRTGVRGFDALTDGGLPGGRMHIVSGPPGSGKTTFALQFILEGIRNDERCLFISMHEQRAELVRAMDDYSFTDGDGLDSERLHFINIFDEATGQFLVPERDSDYTTSVRHQAKQVSSFIESNGIERVAFDSMMVLTHFFAGDDSAVIRFLTALKQTEATTVLVSETTDPSAYSEDQFLAHSVVLLHNFLDREAGEMQRGLQLIKMRGTEIDTNINALEFTPDGLHVDSKVTLEA